MIKDLTLLQDHHPVHTCRQSCMMGDQQDTCSGVFDIVLNQCQHGTLQLKIHRRGSLIQDQKLGLPHDSSRQSDQLRLNPCWVLAVLPTKCNDPSRSTMHQTKFTSPLREAQTYRIPFTLVHC